MSLGGVGGGEWVCVDVCVCVCMWQYVCVKYIVCILAYTHNQQPDPYENYLYISSCI